MFNKVLTVMYIAAFVRLNYDKGRDAAVLMIENKRARNRDEAFFTIENNTLRKTNAERTRLSPALPQLELDDQSKSYGGVLIYRDNQVVQRFLDFETFKNEL